MHRALLKEYGQIKRHSSGVYEEEYQPLNANWHTEGYWNEPQWSNDDEMNMYMEEDFDDVEDSLDDLEIFSDQVDWYDQHLSAVSDGIRSKDEVSKGFEKRMEPVGHQTRMILDQKPPGATESTKSYSKETKDTNISGEEYVILTHLTNMLEQITEFVCQMETHLSSKISDFFIYVHRIFSDIFSPTLKEHNHCWSNVSHIFSGVIHTITDWIPVNSDKCWISSQTTLQDLKLLVIYTMDVMVSMLNDSYSWVYSLEINLEFTSITILFTDVVTTGTVLVCNLSEILSDLVLSVYESEFVYIIREEITDPISGFVLKLYDLHISPMFSYLDGLNLSSWVPLFTNMSDVISKGIQTVQMIQERSVAISFKLLENVDTFVNNCSTKECILSAAADYFQDEKVFFKVIWYIMYIHLALCLLYCTYLSNKLSILVVLNLSKNIVGLVSKILRLFFKHCTKTEKAKSEKVNQSTKCELHQYEVNIPEEEYKDLVAVSNRRLHQLRTIAELQNELQELQAENMVRIAEMCLKQGQVDELEAHTSNHINIVPT